MTRLYIIEYKIYINECGKYGDKKPESRMLLYSKEQRKDFIDKYLYLIKDDFHYTNVECFCIEYGENQKIKDMKSVINAI